MVKPRSECSWREGRMVVPRQPYRHTDRQTTNHHCSSTQQSNHCSQPPLNLSSQLVSHPNQKAKLTTHQTPNHSESQPPNHPPFLSSILTATQPASQSTDSIPAIESVKRHSQSVIQPFHPAVEGRSGSKHDRLFTRFICLTGE